MSRSAFVTGATGFVGTRLVELLTSGGWRVRALVRPTSDTRSLDRLGVERVVGDGLHDSAALAEGVDGADVVYHLAAATTAPDEAGYVRVNAEGSGSIVDASTSARERPRRVVYLSSYAACGPSRDGRPRKLEEAPAPLTAYGRTKLAGELAMETLKAAGIESVVLRAPAVYGPRDQAFLPYFRLVKRRLAPSPTGPERRLHLIFVDDLATALVRAADVPQGIYPVAEAVEHRWSEVVREIARAMQTRPVTVPLPPPLVRMAGALAEKAGDWMGGAGVFNREKAEELLATAWLCDLEGSTSLLAPEEATPLAGGIERTALWYRENGWI